MPSAVTFRAPIEFIDLGAQRRRIGQRMDEAILRVVNHGKYIMGPEVADFEKELAAFCGASVQIQSDDSTFGTCRMWLSIPKPAATAPGDRCRFPSIDSTVL